MFGEKMKAARLALGYSAEQVAAYLKISPATVYRYEKGDIEKMPAVTLKHLADFLCVSQAYLMGWDESEPSLSEPVQVPDPLTPEERHLLDAWRAADDRARDDALKTLLRHCRESKK